MMPPQWCVKSATNLSQALAGAPAHFPVRGFDRKLYSTSRPGEVHEPGDSAAVPRPRQDANEPGSSPLAEFPYEDPQLLTGSEILRTALYL